MTPLALDLKLPFQTDHLVNIAKRKCDPIKRHQFRVDRSEMDPGVMAFLAEHGVTISHAEAFHTPPRQMLGIHVDGPELNNIAKLNWQWGAQGSWMLWWKMKPTGTLNEQLTGIGTRYLTTEASQCIPIYRHQIKQPTLVNVGQLHSVMNMTNEPRWVLSLVLWNVEANRGLYFDEAAERFSQVMAPQPC